jgi:Tol biopolymer transport system component
MSNENVVRFVPLALLCLACASLTGGSAAGGDPALPADGQPAVVFAPGIVSTGDVFASTFTPDGRMVVFTKFTPPRMTLMSSHSFRSRPRKRQVYRAEPRGDGTFGEPQLLSATVNADSGASNLFVDPDERYIVFGAIRPEGRGGVDLYIRWRTGDAWSTPRNLDPLVNTAGTEFCPFVSRDGKYLYFTRISPLGTPLARNVYVVRFDGLRERLKQSSISTVWSVMRSRMRAPFATGRWGRQS